MSRASIDGNCLADKCNRWNRRQDGEDKDLRIKLSVYREHNNLPSVRCVCRGRRRTGVAAPEAFDRPETRSPRRSALSVTHHRRRGYIGLYIFIHQKMIATKQIRKKIDS